MAGEPGAESDLRRRRWRSAAAAVLALGLLAILGGWLASRTTHADVAVQAATARSGGAFAAARPPVPGAPPRAVAAQRTEPSAALPEGWIEVCGEAPVQLAQIEQDPRFLAPASLDELGAALRADPDPRRRAAGLSLGVHQQWQASAERFARRLEACGSDADCALKVQQAVGTRLATGRGAHLEALARLAATSDDAGIHGVAAKMCRAHDDPPTGACRQVSLAEWARRDADNLAPWLYLADTATSPAARAEALHRAGLATRHDDHLAVVFDAALAAAPSQASAVNALSMSMNLLSLWTAHLMPPLGGVTRHCEATALLDGNRLQQCNALAHALVERGSSNIMVLVGARIGERAGWTADRVAGVQAQVAMVQAVQLGLEAPETSFSCKGQAALRQYLAELTQLGEFGAGRAALARASPALLAQAREAARADTERRRAAQASESSGLGSAGASAPVPPR